MTLIITMDLMECKSSGGGSSGGRSSGGRSSSSGRSGGSAAGVSGSSGNSTSSSSGIDPGKLWILGPVFGSIGLAIIICLPCCIADCLKVGCCKVYTAIFCCRCYLFVHWYRLRNPPDDVGKQIQHKAENKEDQIHIAQVNLNQIDPNQPGIPQFIGIQNPIPEGEPAGPVINNFTEQEEANRQLSYYQVEPFVASQSLVINNPFESLDQNRQNNDDLEGNYAPYVQQNRQIIVVNNDDIRQNPQENAEDNHQINEAQDYQLGLLLGVNGHRQEENLSTNQSPNNSQRQIIIQNKCDDSLQL